MQKKFHIRKDDTVRVIAGKDKGREGRVLSVDRDKDRALVEGINMVSKHTKPTAQYPEGGIIKKEATIHVSNLMVVDGDGNATRVGRKLNDDGNLVSYSKKSEKEIKS